MLISFIKAHFLLYHGEGIYSSHKSCILTAVTLRSENIRLKKARDTCFLKEDDQLK
jgi:hypothetical protein